MTNKLAVLASELPIFPDKGSYQYVSEIAGDGRYRQVAWQKTNHGYLALYGTQAIQLSHSQHTIELPKDEEV
ncbi:hypothetical protein NT95_06115 [Oenococcus kitaharae]|uniref:hypothetical protein n=1 Tax=Oenococcus kitaharae TaxID=336988 RepID=UPI000863128F|nr:hypothetical protein [Oenococcus kitaharae]OEY82557.1 hypothetical protein NT95_06115 [Oenococcus kitaharae]